MRGLGECGRYAFVWEAGLPCAFSVFVSCVCFIVRSLYLFVCSWFVFVLLFVYGLYLFCCLFIVFVLFVHCNCLFVHCLYLFIVCISFIVCS